MLILNSNNSTFLAIVNYFLLYLVPKTISRTRTKIAIVTDEKSK